MNYFNANDKIIKCSSFNLLLAHMQLGFISYRLFFAIILKSGGLY